MTDGIRVVYPPEDWEKLRMEMNNHYASLGKIVLANPKVCETCTEEIIEWCFSDTDHQRAESVGSSFHVEMEYQEWVACHTWFEWDGECRNDSFRGSYTAVGCPRMSEHCA